MVPAGDSLDAIYADLDRQLAEVRPRCDISGRCCRFKEYDHSLFLSEMEADRLLADGLPERASIDDGSCPFQINGLCTARERRPFGCRVYFCDPTFQETMVDWSERYIGRLKRLHGQMDLPWRYRSLGAVLRERFPDRVGVTPAGGILPIRELP